MATSKQLKARTASGKRQAQARNPRGQGKATSKPKRNRYISHRVREAAHKMHETHMKQRAARAEELAELTRPKNMDTIKRTGYTRPEPRSFA